MDFSFISDANLLKKADNADPKKATTSAKRDEPRITFQIPSYKEVAHAERPAAAPSMFRASTAPSSSTFGASTSGLPGRAPGAIEDQNKRQRTGPYETTASGSSTPGASYQANNHMSAAPNFGAQGGPGTSYQGNGQVGAGASYPASGAMGPGPSYGAQSRPGSSYQASGRVGAGPSHGGHAGSGASYQASGPMGPGPSYGAQGGPGANYPGAGQSYGGQLATIPGTAERQMQAAPLPTNAILVSKRQKGNPVLNHIRNVRWQFADIVADYLLGANTAGLFLSLRYHLLHPDYILGRIRQLLRSFRLVVLVVLIDTEDVAKPLGEVTRAAVLHDVTLVCGWTPEECARYLETYKAFESKPASAIQERVEGDYVSRLAAVLCEVRGVNRSDSHALVTSLGSLADVIQASPEQLSGVPGIGPTKVRRLHEAFHEPFRKVTKPLALPAPSSTPLLAAATRTSGISVIAAAAAAAPSAAAAASAVTLTNRTPSAAAAAVPSSAPASAQTSLTTTGRPPSRTDIAPQGPTGPSIPGVSVPPVFEPSSLGGRVPNRSPSPAAGLQSSEQARYLNAAPGATVPGPSVSGSLAAAGDALAGDAVMNPDVVLTQLQMSMMIPDDDDLDPDFDEI